jgi:hypothetical protein
MASVRVAHEPRKCRVCPHVFTPSRKDQVYCGGACKSRALAYGLDLKTEARAVARQA